MVTVTPLLPARPLRGRARLALVGALLVAGLPVVALRQPVVAQTERPLDPAALHFTVLAPDGVLVWWSAADWTVAGDAGDTWTGPLTLGDGENTAVLEVVAGTPAACLDDALIALQTDPAVAALRVLADPDLGTTWYVSEESGFARFAVEHAGATGIAGQEGAAPTVSILSVSCTNGAGQRGVLRDVRRGPPPADPTDDLLANAAPLGYWRPAMPAALAPLPAATWNRVPTAALTEFILGEPVVAAAAVVFRAAVGDTTLDPPPAGQRYATLTVTYTGAGDDAGAAPAVLDPRQFALQDAAGTLYESASYRWEAAPGNPDDVTQTLAPDAVALLVDTFVVPDDAVIANVVCRCAQPFDPDAPFAGFDVQSLPLVPAAVAAPRGRLLSSDERSAIVAIANLDDAPRSLDPAALLLSQPGRPDAPAPVERRWLFPRPGDGAPRTLVPGEIAVLWLDYGDAGFRFPDRIIDTTDPAAPVVAAGLFGGQGAGGRTNPVVIDME